MTERPTLTAAQGVQLIRLYNAGAVCSDVAKSARDVWLRGLPPLNPMLLGELRDLGLIDSRDTYPPFGNPFPCSWLTPAGVARAQELVAAP